ncbi:MAG: flagellar biosynthetic protein FliO [Thiotrichales bacterium]
MDRKRYTRWLLAGYGFIACAQAHAGDSGLTLPGPGTPEIGKLIFTLIVMVAAFAALAWWMRRLGGGLGGFNQAALKVRASLAVGTRERLVIVQVGEHHLLLGVTGHQINKLHELTPADVETLQNENTSEFAARFRKALHKDAPK